MAIGVSTAEGKLPLPFAAYKFLVQILFESAKPEHIAAHTFLVLKWNLISFADIVVTALIDSIHCHNDAILFEIGRTKMDQERTRNIDHPWHLYANCEFPQICTFLAMACHLISCPKILEGGCVLFLKVWISVINLIGFFLALYCVPCIGRHLCLLACHLNPLAPIQSGKVLSPILQQEQRHALLEHPFAFVQTGQCLA
jgi:hypothetical protein